MYLSIMILNLNLKEWLIEALNHYGGKASIVQVCKHIWDNHKKELENSGDLFYTWQYDIRWTAQNLRDKGKLRNITKNKKSYWEIVT